MKTPAERISEYLKENGITKAFVCRKTGISNSKLNEKLKGRVKISADDIEIICWALDKKPTDFLKPRPPEEIGAW